MDHVRTLPAWTSLRFSIFASVFDLRAAVPADEAMGAVVAKRPQMNPKSHRYGETEKHQVGECKGNKTRESPTNCNRPVNFAEVPRLLDRHGTHYIVQSAEPEGCCAWPLGVELQGFGLCSRQIFEFL